MTKYISKLAIFLLNVIRWAFIAVLLITLLGIIATYTNMHDYPRLNYVLSIDKFIYQKVKDTVPTKIMNYDCTRVIIIIAILIVLDFIKVLIRKIKLTVKNKLMKEELAKLKVTRLEKDKEKAALLKKKMVEVNATTKNRRDLLKEFAKIKTEVGKVGRDLAFLAIDVVDSTKMKIGEGPVIVENDFLEYHQFVDNKLKENGLIKASWTPDGVMACFNTVEEAIQAAQGVLNNLDHFNQNIKTMRKMFNVRCGINAGHVYYDDAFPLEQFSDRTIDIAGHMQKYAPTNTILIAKNLILKDSDKFSETTIVVDGFDVCQWTKNS